MLVRETMTKSDHYVSLNTPLVEAARLMRVHDIVAMPVVEGRCIVGMLTDRDIVVQAVATGLDLQRARVREVMSQSAIFIFEHQPLHDAVAVMQAFQLRQLPVLNRDSELVGILSRGDVARAQSVSPENLRSEPEPMLPVG